MNHSGNNWSKLKSNFAFALNTSVNYTNSRTLYEIVFGTKRQSPKTLILGQLRYKNKQWKSEVCNGHTQSENNLLYNSLSRLLRPQLSDALLKREGEFKQNSSSTYQRCRQIMSKAHKQRNPQQLGNLSA